MARHLQEKYGGTTVLETSVSTNTVRNYIRQKAGEIEAFKALSYGNVMHRERENALRKTAHSCYIVKELSHQPSQATGY